MNKNKSYKLNLVLNSNILHIKCMLAVAVMQERVQMEAANILDHSAIYGFEKVCMLGSTPDFLTCNDVLQSWNQPQGPKVDPIQI